MKLEFSRQIFENYSTTFNENPSNWGRVGPWGRTDGRTDRQTDVAKVIVVSRNFANAPDEWRSMNNISCDCMLLVVITRHKQLVIHCLTAWITALCVLYFPYFSVWTLDVFVALQMFCPIVLPSSARVRRLKQSLMICSGVFLSINHF